MTCFEHHLADRRDKCTLVLYQRKLPLENRLKPGDFEPSSHRIKVMTMRASKGLEFPVVALPGVRHMPAPGRRRRRLYGCIFSGDRATQGLVIVLSGSGVIRKVFNK